MPTTTAAAEFFTCAVVVHSCMPGTTLANSPAPRTHDTFTPAPHCALSLSSPCLVSPSLLACPHCRLSTRPTCIVTCTMHPTLFAPPPHRPSTPPLRTRTSPRSPCPATWMPCIHYTLAVTQGLTVYDGASEAGGCELLAATGIDTRGAAVACQVGRHGSGLFHDT